MVTSKYNSTSTSSLASGDGPAAARLVFVSYNLHGYNQGVHGVRDVISSVSPDVLFLQEHWLTPANLHKLRDVSSEYFVYASSSMEECVAQGPLQGRPFGGIATLIKNKYAAVTCNIVNRERFSVTKILNWLTVNVYMPCIGTKERESIYSDTLCELDSFLCGHNSCDVMVGGDFNTDLSKCSKYSDLISDFIRRHKLHRCDVLSPVATSYTYFSEALNCNSTIDYMLVSNSESVAAFNILDIDVNLSDHLPLLAVCVCDSLSADKCNNQCVAEPNSDTYFLRWDHGPLDQYYEHTRCLVQPIFENLRSHNWNLAPTLADEIYSKVTYALKLSADVVIPRHKKSFYKFWWNQELSELKERAIVSCRVWKEAGKPRHGDVHAKYKHDKMLYKKHIREQQRQETECITNDLHDALMRKSGREFWSVWKSKFDSNTNKITHVNGTSDCNIIASTFAKHFKATCCPHNASRNQELKSEYLLMRSAYEQSYKLTDIVGHDKFGDKFDVKLVSDLVTKMKSGKAADLYGLTAEHLKYCHPVVLVILCKLFNFFLSSGHVPASFGASYTVPIPKVVGRFRQLTVEDFRGISISPVVSKLFELAILDRFNQYFETSHYQFGFKKNLSCPDLIYCVRNVIEHYISNGSTVNVCSIDLSKAFDRMNHYALFIKLMKRNFPYSLLVLLENWFQLATTCVRWYGFDSAFYCLNAGVRQGGVLSPFLFAIFIDDIVGKVQSLNVGCYINNVFVGVFLYADDILLIAPSVYALQAMLSMCEQELIHIDMRLNSKKSVCIRFGNRFDKSCAPIVACDGLELSWVNTCRYLGIYFASSRQFKCSFDSCKKSFYKSFNAVFGKIGRLASEDVTLSLIKAKCIPQVLYGIEACPISKRDKSSLDFTLTRVLMKIFCTKSLTVVKQCQFYFNLFPITYLMDIRTAKFLNKFALSDNDICSLFVHTARVATDSIYLNYGSSVDSVCKLRSAVADMLRESCT